MTNENGSTGGTHDISEEIRKAKEVAQSLAGKEVSIVFTGDYFVKDFACYMIVFSWQVIIIFFRSGQPTCTCTCRG